MHGARILACAVLALAPITLSVPAAAAAGPAGTPYPRPAVCVDQAAVLGTETCARITRVLGADERATTDEIAVVVVRSTGGVSIETWGTGLFNHWGVGKQGENNGVLLVVATDDRRLRIVTGSGLADRLPDGAASEIIGGTITPLFRAGRIQDGVLAGLDQIRLQLGHDVDDSNQLADPDVVPIPAVTDSQSDSTPVWLSAAIVVFLVGVVGGVGYLVLSGNQRFWDRFDSGSSGSSRFGGGSSSGGGASGSW